MMMNKTNRLLLGYDLDMWRSYGTKLPVTTDISPSTNSHMVICGMSGGGKTYAEQWYISNLVSEESGICFFADYKGDDSFSHLRGLPRYYSFKNTLKALDEAYTILNERLSGSVDRTPITLIWDEYMANILSLIGEDKKLAALAMNKVSEILLMGRSIGVRLIVTCQRPDAVAFPAGSRLNYGIVVILGAYINSIYEMLMPDFKIFAEGRIFNRGEGVVLLQGTALHFIKIPTVRDIERMQERCIQALSQ